MREQLNHSAAPVPVSSGLPDEMPDRRSAVRRYGPGHYPDYINDFCNAVERSLSLLQTHTGATCSVHFDNQELNGLLRRNCRIPDDYIYIPLAASTDYAIVPNCEALRGGPVDLGNTRHDHGSIIIYPVRAKDAIHIGQIYLEYEGTQSRMDIQHGLCAMAADVLRLAADKVYLGGQKALSRLDLMNMTLSRLQERDPDTFRHCERVSKWSGLLAQRMGLSAKDVRQVIDAGYLHDVGKSYIPNEILNKCGNLTKQEYAEIRKHPVYGYEMLSKFQSFQDTAPIVRAHHERWDGTGYPDGLAGEEIPFHARILSVIDAAEAVVSGRTYRPPLRWPEAVKELQACSGTQFDPKVVDAFVRMVKKDNFQLLSL